MRRKLVYRYYCDFCKKSGCSSYWIKQHEERCTMNPNRECGMCTFTLGIYDKEKLEEAKKILEPYKGLHSEYNEGYYTEAILPDDITKKLRELVEDCPACIMAALRQSNIEVAAMRGFNFDQESKNMLAERNAELCEHPRDLDLY